MYCKLCSNGFARSDCLWRRNLWWQVPINSYNGIKCPWGYQLFNGGHLTLRFQSNLQDEPVLQNFQSIWRPKHWSELQLPAVSCTLLLWKHNQCIGLDLMVNIYKYLLGFYSAWLSTTLELPRIGEGRSMGFISVTLLDHKLANGSLALIKFNHNPF